MREISTEADIQEGLERLCRLDHDLEEIVNRVKHVPLRREKPDFATLSRIVIGQQVSRASAAAIHQRFKHHIDPVSPAVFLAAGEPVWIEIGLSRAKQRTLHELSNFIVDGRLDLTDLASDSADEALEKLTAITGIGRWTAEVFLLFGVGHPDIFPAGDLALKHAARQFYSMECVPKENELRKLAAKWSPYRGIAARLFWAYYGIAMNRGDQGPV